MTPTQRQERYMEQSEQIQELYSSIEAAKHNKAISLKYQFTDAQFTAYLDITGDTILGFYPSKELPTRLQKEVGVSSDIAQRIVADIAEFLSPVLAREAELTNPKLGAIKELHQQFQQAGGTAPQATEPPKAIEPAPPATTPVPEAEPIHNVTPMRTMAADMTRVHGYGAYRQANPQPSDDGVIRTAPQDELLKERPRLTNTPQLGV